MFFSSFLVLLSFLPNIANAEAALKLAEPVECPSGTGNCYKITNPKIEGKPKLTLVQSKPPLQTPTGKTPLAPGIAGTLIGTVTSLAMLTPLGQDIYNQGAEAITKLDYAAYDFVHDILLPKYQTTIDNLATQYVDGNRILIHGTETMFNDIVNWIDNYMYNNANASDYANPTHDWSELTWKPTSFSSTYKWYHYVGITYKAGLTYGYSYFYINEKVGTYKPFYVWLFDGNSTSISPNYPNGYLSVQFSTLAEAMNYTMSQLKHTYYDKTTAQISVPSSHGDVSPSIKTDQVSVPYTTDQTTMPAITQIDNTKYWEVPQTDGNIHYQPINDPAATPTADKVVMDETGQVLNPDGVPTGETVNPNEYEIPQTTDPTPTDPTPTDPITSDIVNPFLGTPEDLLLSLLSLLRAIIEYMARMFAFILTIPLIPPISIENPAFEWFKTVKIMGVQIYIVVSSMASIGLSFLVYKSIRRVLP